MNINPENDASEYIRMRTRRALELKAMRKALADIEAEEATDRKILKRLGTTVAASIALASCLIVYNILKPEPSQSHSLPLKSIAPVMSPLPGEKTKCKINLPFLKDSCIVKTDKGSPK